MDASNKPVLQCDACHHEVEVDHIDETLIGYPCPVCHECMFTTGHWRTWRRLSVWRWFSAIWGFIFFWQKPKDYRVTIRDRSLEIREK